uniref:Uncharacterized protein n=1 Tax=viral metagenome TaxID=1070528 RepID=A0A6C0E925_9ZZZZ
MSDEQDDNLSSYYGTYRDTGGHYNPSVSGSGIPTLTHLQPNVYGYYTRANGLISFDNIKGLPLSYFHSYESQYRLEHSNKIILPSSILVELSKYDNIVYPLMFQVDGTNDILGVADFVDDIDIAYLPNRIFNKMIINFGINDVKDIREPISIGLKLHNQEIARGVHTILRAHDAKFLEIDDHQSYLQMHLQQFYSILQEGEILELPAPDFLGYPENTFLKIDVLKTKPESTILITDTNLIIDFEEPINYTEYFERKTRENQRIKQTHIDSINQNYYDYIRQFIPEYNSTFWDDREKKALQDTNIMPLPYITLPNGKTIYKLKFMRPVT